MPPPPQMVPPSPSAWMTAPSALQEKEQLESWKHIIQIIEIMIYAADARHISSYCKLLHHLDQVSQPTNQDPAY
jgi:hypothetical protein